MNRPAIWPTPVNSAARLGWRDATMKDRTWEPKPTRHPGVGLLTLTIGLLALVAIVQLTR